jgi:hypothetical protein
LGFELNPKGENLPDPFLRCNFMALLINAAKNSWMLLALGVGWTAAYAVGPHPFMAVVLVLWVGALAALVLSERHLLLLFFMLLPFINLLKRLIFLDQSVGTIETYMVLAAQDLLLGGIVLKAFIRAVQEKSRPVLSGVDGAVCAFGLYSMLSVLLLSPGASWTARLAALESLVWPITMYFLAVRYLNRKSDLLTLSNLTIIFACFVALYGICQFIWGLNPFEQAWYEDMKTASSNVLHMERDLRDYGIFRTFSTLDSHGTYGIFLGIGLILAWARRFRIGTLTWIGASLLMGAGILVSFTRYTWVMPIVAALCFLALQSKKLMSLISIRSMNRIVVALLGGLVGSFLILTLILSGLYKTELVSPSNPYVHRAFETNTLYARIQWRDFFSPQDASLFGNGLAATGRLAGKFEFESGDINYHNIFIDMMDSLGLFGLILFLLLLYLLLKRALITIRYLDDPLARRLLAALFALVLAMLWVGHFNGAVFYHGRAVPYFFWGFCGILAHYPREEKFQKDLAGVA